MNEAERERRIAEVSDFRFKVVAELANPYLSAAQRRRLISEKASMEYDVPGLGRRRLSEACIRKWLTLYRKGGKAGLQPRTRRDAGSSRALTRAEAALLLNHLEEKPQLNATTVLRELQKSGAITSTPSSSSLSRLVRSAGLQREKRLRKADAERNLKFDFFAPLECVQADFMYALKIRDEKGKLRHALLLAFLDDATRRVLYATFSFSESSLAFEAGIKHILSTHGRIGRLYCDNGSPFLSSQTRRILDSLALVIIHSRPGKPAGRGKIERFFRTARDQFFRTLDPQGISSLADLEQRFHSWLEGEYHRSPHRGLAGQSPLEAWLAKAHHIIPLDPTVNLKTVFLHETTRKVHKDSTITLEGVLFEVPSNLIAERIKIRYDPHVPITRRRLLIYHNGAPLEEARIVDSYANTRVRRGDLQRSIQITEEKQQPGPGGPVPRRPVDNSLSASRLDWDQDDQPPEHQR
jgi:transposase InsO family protein